MNPDRGNRVHRRRYLALAGAGLLGLAGCQGDPAGDGGGPSTATTDAPPGAGTATPTRDAGPDTATEPPGPSEPHSTVPLPPDRQRAPDGERFVEQLFYPRIPSGFDHSAYGVQAAPADVAAWYGTGRDGWERDYEVVVDGSHHLTFTKGDTTAIVLVLENRQEAGSFVTVSSGFRSAVFTGPPPLGHLGVEVGPYDPSTGRAGGFDFDRLVEVGEPDGVPIMFFGDELPGEGAASTNPAFEYRTAPDATVYASIDGTVELVEDNPGFDDGSILLAALDGYETCLVDHDHVRDITVAEGDTVSAGDPLGLSGEFWEDGLGRTEVQMSNTVGAHLCSFRNVQAGRREELEGRLTQLIDEWDEVAGDDQGSTAFVAVGCEQDEWVQSD